MYKLSATETHNEKATEFETKSLFYLMTYFNESKSIYWLVIDFFNDVTGVDKLNTKCFDVQSKNINNITPVKLGAFTVTLFKNYLSELNFSAFVLFVKGVSKKILSQIGGKKLFLLSDLDDETQQSVINGLITEANNKSYIENKKSITTLNALDFLSKVAFVIDDKEKEQYILDAVNLSENISFDSIYLGKLFKEIRDKQSSKKNNDVEGEIIENIGDFVKFDKYLTVDDIQLLLMQRLCFKDVFSKRGTSIPNSFVEIFNELDIYLRTDQVQACQDDIIRVLFDSNNRKNYWSLFNDIVVLIKNGEKSVNDIYKKLDKKHIENVMHLNELSCKYFISIIKDRVNYD